MDNTANTGLSEYNTFCRNSKEGDILYNLDSTNCWGEYLLVANVSKVVIKGVATYTMLLLGLMRKEGSMVPLNIRIKLTPEYHANIPFLKYVGHCSFRLIPTIDEMDFNLGLAAVYGSTDLWKYKEKLSIRKPRRRKYGRDGKPVIKKAGNE